jgi:hypothetical protein
MKFEEALKAMREGKKVKRPCMPQKISITETEGGKQYILIYHQDYGFVPYRTDSDDILAEDWEIVDE